MWCSDRRAFLGLGAAAALAGCGLRPVYGPDSPLAGGVLVNSPDSREAFRLKARIEDRLGPPTAPAYALTIGLSLAEQPVGVSTGQDITRYTLRGAADYRLIATATGALLDSGRVTTLTGYSATGTSVATLAAERDARDRLAVALADLIVSRTMIAVA